MFTLIVEAKQDQIEYFQVERNERGRKTRSALSMFEVRRHGEIHRAGAWDKMPVLPISRLKEDQASYS